MFDFGIETADEFNSSADFASYWLIVFTDYTRVIVVQDPFVLLGNIIIEEAPNGRNSIYDRHDRTPDQARTAT